MHGIGIWKAVGAKTHYNLTIANKKADDEPLDPFQ